jgi:hypothetical protein
MVEDTPQSFLRTPLLNDDNADSTSLRVAGESGLIRQRGSTTTFNNSALDRLHGHDDVEQQQQTRQSPPPSPPPHHHHRRPQQQPGQHPLQRILDRSGNLRQSRGRWGVDRQNHHQGGPSRQQLFCCRRMYHEWGKDWFFWLAYQKTCVLFLLLFVSYGLIIVFFGFIYLVSVV